jgi:hypothetical protein
MTKNRLKVETIEISGIATALKTLRRPFKLEVRSEVNSNYDSIIGLPNNNDYKEYSIYSYGYINIHKTDLALMQRLIKNGDEESKFSRLIMAYMTITAPRWWWVEMSTYEVGVIKGCGESTMHTDCKGLNGEELMEFKDNMPQGNLETRDMAFSYQALRRIFFQRRDHRLPIWGLFCEHIKTLPLAEELITIE